jgi:SAM-dependent methyltransferase
MSHETTRAVYDAQAGNWSRSDRMLLSDFTARPFVIEHLSPLHGCRVLDLGCGEGYVSRLALQAGARSVFGIDLSESMVQKACQQAPVGADTTYRTADISDLTEIPSGPYDRVMAVFLFNYLNRAEMVGAMRLARESLVPGGRFVFTVPHPCYPYLRRPEPPFYFQTDGVDYYAGVDKVFEGRIWRRDGVGVSVRCVHKRFADYFDALAASGWHTLPRVVELTVSEQDVANDPAFFGPLVGTPLHLLFQLEMTS